MWPNSVDSPESDEVSVLHYFWILLILLSNSEMCSWNSSLLFTFMIIYFLFSKSFLLGSQPTSRISWVMHIQLRTLSDPKLSMTYLSKPTLSQTVFSSMISTSSAAKYLSSLNYFNSVILYKMFARMIIFLSKVWFWKPWNSEIILWDKLISRKLVTFSRPWITEIKLWLKSRCLKLTSASRFSMVLIRFIRKFKVVSFWL